MTISVYLVLWLWFAHWVGDFVLQTYAMARGKSTSNVHLTDHVAVYALTLMVATLPLYGAMGLFWGGINGVLHWLTDYVTSRINARLWAAGRVHDFFVGVGADQFVHLSTLVLTAWWLLP